MKQRCNPKLSYYTVRNLFKKTRHTELKTETKSDGAALFKVFYEDYEITAFANGKEKLQNLRLLKNGKRNFKIVL